VVEGEMVVLDRHHEFIHQLNLTATYIWERCDGKASLEDIAAQLAETFAVAYETALKDVVQVIRQFQDLQLLEINRDHPVCSTP
jgi:methyltransferase-like protein